MRTLRGENAESDHNLVFGFRLSGRIAPNRPKRVVKNRRAIDLPGLMADLHLRMNFQEALAAKLASSTLRANTRSVDDMTSVLTETLLSIAADIARGSAQTSTEGLVCDRGDENVVECTMAGLGRRE